MHVLQSGTLGLYVTLLASALKISIGQNEPRCPSVVYVEEIKNEGQIGVLKFNELECNVTIQKQADAASANENLVLIIGLVACAGILLSVLSTSIAFCLCCCKCKDTSVDKDQDIEQQLVSRQPHCAPPSGPAPLPDEKVKEETDDNYASAPPLNRKDSLPVSQPSIQSAASSEDHIKTPVDVNSQKDPNAGVYLEPDTWANQKTAPEMDKTANPPKYRSKSLTDDVPSQLGPNLFRPGVKPSVRSVSTGDSNFDTRETVAFKEELTVAVSKDRNSIMDGQSYVNNASSYDKENEINERCKSQENDYDRVEIINGNVKVS